MANKGFMPRYRIEEKERKAFQFAMAWACTLFLGSVACIRRYFQGLMTILMKFRRDLDERESSNARAFVGEDTRKRGN